jgi:4-hydroxy-3-polyprenylbenzoate decarboxylase
MAAEDLVVAMTGASGAAYGIRLVEVLLRAGRRVHFTFSPAAAEVIQQELNRSIDPEQFVLAELLGESADALEHTRFQYHHYRDYKAGIASGSFLTGGMVVCPCSMNTLAAIAHGISENLVHRAADVHLKERRKLILVPRETPLGLVQLRNMTALTEVGAVILPAMPGFYHRPDSIGQLIDFVVHRIVDQLGVPSDLLHRWGNTSDSAAST